MKQNEICFLFNYASHYRAPIYKLLNDNIDCDFYFGDKTYTPIKKLDYDLLSNFRREFTRIDLFNNFYFLKGISSLLFKKYDVFILSGEPYCLSDWFLLIYCKLFKKKTYLWTHGWYGRETKLKTLIKKIFYKLSDGLFLYGDYAKRLMMEEGFKDDKLIPIYNSLDYDKHLKIRDTLKSTNIYKNHFKNDYPTLIFVGRIQKSKRIDMVFDAMNQLNKQGINVNFVIIGDSTNIDMNNDILKNDNLRSRVWFYGPCYDEEKLGELFFNACVCISPGNVGLTAVHSLSFGTPVITHSNFPYQGPEFEAIIDGKTGSFFIQNNVGSLTEKIIMYININPKKRRKINETCYRIIDDRYNPYFQLSIIKKSLMIDYTK